MCEEWLIENSDAPIKYILTNDKSYISELLENFEVKYWLSKLKERAENKDLSNIHGSHDYRYENILGKCAILGLSKDIPEFDENIKYILEFLHGYIKNKEIEKEKLSFEKMYAYRDYETITACFLPMLGYHDDPAVRYITEKRINIAYDFTKQKNYDIYVDGSKLKGVKKEWQPYIINPDLYSDGNISIPSAHDYILFAGMYKYLDQYSQDKIENIAEWLLSKDYPARYGYFYVEGGQYNAKAILMTLTLHDFNYGLLYSLYILSHFRTAVESDWFNMALAYLDDFKIPGGIYNFSNNMLTEKPDNYVIKGGHMNVGENKRSKKYRELLSTYWMHKINKNIIRNDEKS